MARWAAGRPRARGGGPGGATPRPHPAGPHAPHPRGGRGADPRADLLLARGVPFVFIPGYQRDSIARRYANVPVLPKPIDAAALEGVLLTLLAGESLMRAAEGG